MGPDELADVRERVEALEHLERLRVLKARYFRLLDLKQWDAWGEVFAEDGVLEVPEMDFRAEGRDAIVAAVRTALDGVVTVHHGHMGELALVDATHATGIWPMEDHVVWTPLSGERRGSHVLHGYGHYVERYRLEEERWTIEHSHLSRLHAESVKVRHHRDVAGVPHS
jgi:hypothetical protein